MILIHRLVKLTLLLTFLGALGCSLNDSTNDDVEPLFKIEQVLSGENTITKNTCSIFGLVLRVNEAESNPFPTIVPFLLGGNGSGTFYANEDCTLPLPENVLIVQTGSTSAVFYFKDPQAESLVLNSTASTGGSVTFPVTVTD